MGSQIVFSEFDIFHLILVYLSRNNNTQAQGRRFPALRAPEPGFPVIFGSKWDPLTSAWRQGGASPERLAELPTGVSPLQKRIWKWDFYHYSSCNFFFHICFCHLWCELLLSVTESGLKVPESAQPDSNQFTSVCQSLSLLCVWNLEWRITWSFQPGHRTIKIES